MILLLLLLFSILPVSRSVVPYIIKCVTEPLSESLYDLAGKRREVKSKGDKERYKPLNAEFQRTARRGKQAFLSDQCKEIEENSRMGKTRDLSVREEGGGFRMESILSTFRHLLLYCVCTISKVVKLKCKLFLVCRLDKISAGFNFQHLPSVLFFITNS